MSIGLAEGGDFFLIIEFLNLTIDEIGVLNFSYQVKEAALNKIRFF